jgi:dTDP-4-dehydrorhamnose reductase
MKALILGGAGMLGHKLHQQLSKHVETHVTLRRFDEELRGFGIFDEANVHEGVDASDFATVAGALRAIRADWVINCIGVIKQRPEAGDPEACIAINALFPHRLARECRQVGARLVHFSTDCVFSGARGNYTENDAADAADLYGRTKLLGEVDGPGAITIRTSIVGSSLRDDRSLFDWFLSRGRQPVKGYCRAVYTGLTTERLAQEVWTIISRHPGLSGVWHVSSEKISKFDLLMTLKRAMALPTEVARDYDYRCDRSLSCEKYRAATGFAPPRWEEMIDAYARDRLANYRWRRLDARG